MECQANAPEFRVATQRYSDEELVILSVSVGESPDVVRDFVARFGLENPFVVDSSGSIASAYGLVSTPTTYSIDAAGNIVEKREGVVSQAWIDQAANQGGG